MTDKPPSAVARALSPVGRALWAGAIAGFAVGLGDMIWAWGRLGQFLPGAGGRLRAGLYEAGLTAAAAALGAALAAVAIVALWRWTALGRLWRHAAETRAAARDADPRRALAGVSLAIVGVPLVLTALFLAWRIGLQTITVRHHRGLIIVVTVGATVGLMAAAAVAAVAIGAMVESLLRLLPTGAVRVLSCRWAPLVAAVGPIVVGGVVAAVLSRRTLAQLDLRPHTRLLAVAVVMIPAWWIAGKILARLGARLPRRAREAMHPAVVAVPLLVAFVAGASGAVRKGAHAHLGLAAPIARAIQWIGDVDRDGYSPLLGGGDCDDWNGSIHPGASDLADDGVDQNCLGGDRKVVRPPADLRFVPVPKEVPEDVNVVLITIDTLRADHMGAYGYGRDTTPTLDALADEGALFENAWAHAPSTRYSMPAILTGRYPSQVLWDPAARTPASWWPGLQLQNLTIAEALKARGFSTGALLNYEYFDRARRMDQGFDEYSNDNARLHTSRGDPAATRGTSSREQADAAISWVTRHAGGRFFLWVHFYDPHFEYERHAGTKEYGPGKVDLYDHEIRFTDDQIGRLFAALREAGLWDKTAVVVTGDHGEGFGEHGIDFHGYHLYAAQTKVPLIVRVPHVAPRLVSTPAGHVDLLPTLANLAGGSPESGMFGRSLLGEVAGRVPGDADRDIYQEVSYEGNHERRAAATKRWHLIYNMSPDNSWELYDLTADPQEARDVIGAHEGDPDIEKLKARLLEWIDSAQLPPDAAEKMAQAVLKQAPTPQISVDVDFGDAVQLLGYDLSPTQARPGEDVTITWYFRCAKPLRGPWGMFVHVEPRGGGAGRFVGDHDPVGGALPFEQWRKGWVVADKQTLRVPAGTRPGEYALRVGLWKRGTNQRATARGTGVGIQENRVDVGTLTVVQ